MKLQLLTCCFELGIDKSYAKHVSISRLTLYWAMGIIMTYRIDGWAVTVGTAMRGLGGLGPRPVPSSLYQT